LQTKSFSVAALNFAKMDNYFSKLRETLEQKLADTCFSCQVAHLTRGVRPSLGSGIQGF